MGLEKQDSVMKVGYVAPMSIAAVNGGMRNQALNTISKIHELGIETVKLSPWEDLSELNLDLVHIFGASVENIGIVNQLYNTDIPIVLSPIFYSNRSASFINRVLNVEQFLKPLSRGIRSDFSVQRDLCKKADLLLPNTADESMMIREAFSITEERIIVTPNGVESHFEHANPGLFLKEYGCKDFVLFAGQAGAERKNVIKLLEISDKMIVPVVIIGSFYDDSYGKKCLNMASELDNVILIETLDHDSELLASAYAASKVFVLPSQFETPGIAAMEAALTGSQVVITKNGGTKEYFGDHVNYIDPNSANSLLQGIQNALAQEQSDDLKVHILQNYTWNKVAKMTAENYQTLIS